MLWNVYQLSRDGRTFSQELIEIPKFEKSDKIDLQLNIFLSRINLISDEPQYSFYVSAGGQENIDKINMNIHKIKSIVDANEISNANIYNSFLPIFDEIDALSIKAMLYQRVVAGIQRDKQVHTIFLIMISFIGLIASGAILSFLLLLNIKNLKNVKNDLLVTQLEQENVIINSTTELKAALENEKEMTSIYKNFITMASHQFKTPITIIDMIAQIYIKYPKGVTEAVLIENFKKIRVAVRKLNLIINSIIDNERLIENNLNPKMLRFDFVDMLKKTCEYHLYMYPDRKINISLSSEEFIFNGDDIILEQMILNLLSNAEKYSPNSLPIDVCLKVVNNAIICSVTDFGIGIPEDELNNIFERFFRASNVSHLSGSGLGLSLSMAFARLHGGTICCNSSMNKTTFQIILPLDGIKQ